MTDDRSLLPLVAQVEREVEALLATTRREAESFLADARSRAAELARAERARFGELEQREQNLVLAEGRALLDQANDAAERELEALRGRIDAKREAACRVIVDLVLEPSPAVAKSTKGRAAGVGPRRSES